VKAERRRVGIGVAVVVAAAAALALVVLPASGDPATDALDGDPHPPAAGADLLLDEDFAGDRVDPAVWNTCHWWAVDGGCTIESNDELEWYQAGNVAVADGVLRLEAREQAVVTPDGGRYPYTSGMISSGPAPGDGDRPVRFAFTYGYVEALLRLPSDTGLWPAFWLLPADEESRPEIDIVETVGDDTDTARFHFHYVDDDGEERSLGHDWSGADLAAGWHTFAVDWRPGVITWIVDGRERWRVEGAMVPDEPMYVVLNLAVGGVYPGPPDDETEFPAVVEADWVRVHEAP
jgi:beta-glucanase (GH16 family)